jgi:hypothetical protein
MYLRGSACAMVGFLESFGLIETPTPGSFALLRAGRIDSVKDGRGSALDFLVAVVGSLVGGAIVWSGISGMGMVAMFVIGGTSAVIAIVAQRTLWPSTRTEI